MAELGRAALIVCLGLSAYALVGGAVAARTGRRRLALSAQNAVAASFAAAVVASAVLLAALLGRDFSNAYVAAYTSSRLPFQYTLSAFWGGQEGSLLFWLLVLTGYSTLAVVLNRRRHPQVLAWTVPVLAFVQVFFALLLVAVASPFQTQPPLLEGRGLNPSLQNPYMAAHPPFLYLGYVGLTVPFAFAEGSLVAGRRADLVSVLDDLAANERTVLRRRFGLEGEPQTLEAIGRQMGVTRERVRQIEAAGLRKLRALLRARGVEADDAL